MDWVIPWGQKIYRGGDMDLFSLVKIRNLNYSFVLCSQVEDKALDSLLFQQDKGWAPCIFLQSMPIYLASAYIKYSDLEKANKI